MRGTSVKTRKVPIEKLRLSGRLSSRLWVEALGIENRLRAPGALTNAALELIACLHPIHVTATGGGHYDVVANHVVANLLQRLPGKTPINVVVWPEKEVVSPKETLFLTYLLFGLQAGQQDTVLRLYQSLSPDERSCISPHLKSRSGLEKLSGVSRKIAITDQIKSIGKDDQMALEI